MNNPIFPPPGAPVSQTTDRFGDTLEISPSGDGYVLFSIIPKDPTVRSLHVELPAPYMVVLFGAAIQATGRSARKLADMAVALGLVKEDRPQKMNRAQRRGASFFKK